MKPKVEPINFLNLKQVVDFLKEDEHTCITLMSRFVKNGKIDLLPKYIKGFSFYFDKKLVGVMAISTGGGILHHFLEGVLNHSEERKVLEELLYPILKGYSVYSIVGDMLGSDFLKEVIQEEKCPKIKIPYTLMKFDCTKANSKFQNTLQDFGIKKCSTKDIETLYPLQAAYEVVEVLPPGEDFNPDNCRLNLRHNLGNQYIIGAYLKKTGQFVAKAGSNALGLNWVQLGGVFTREEFRGQGLATLLVEQIALDMKEINKKVALFVKDSNEFARRAYEKAGFIPISKFCIYYY
jgi:predicted GNAT family acetyltransferase